MLLKRRCSAPAISLLMLVVILIGSSCTVNELPQPVDNPANPPVANNSITCVILDISSFVAKPKTILLGEQTVLSWKTVAATSLSIEPGIGNIGVDTQSITVSPKATTLYTLRASDGCYEVSQKFLVIVKTADGAIVWPQSSSENVTPEPIYEGWSHYPNKFVEWTILDRNKDTGSDIYNCWHQGRIINHHNEWKMTDVTVSGKAVASQISPSEQVIYVTSMDCLQLPELKWKWKLAK